MEFHLSRDWTEGSGAPLAGPPESGRAPELNGESFQRPTFRAQQDTYAALDLGTNNCRLLIARPTYDAFRIIDAFSRIVRLGEGLGSSGRLGEDAILRTLGALAVCRDKMRAKGVTRARLIATEACRAAENGGEFLARVPDELGVDLEIVDRETEAQRLAEVLDQQNRERQDVEKRIAQEALERVRNRFDPQRDLVIVEGDASWHIGVVGIVASRVLREFHRPTLILGGDGTVWRGSGRSVSGFDLAAALRDCTDLLEKHGGHAMAAGLSIDPARLETFRQRINDLARERLRPEHLQPEVRIDAAIPLRALSLPVVGDLRRLEPFGIGNPVVQLAVRGLTHARSPQRLKELHWKFWVTDGGAPVETVWWGAGDRPIPEGRFDLAVIPEAGEYGGRRFLQLRLIDWKPSDPA